MKIIIAVMFLIVLVIWFPIFVSQAEVKNNELQGRITISGAWALYPMAVKWAEEFKKIYPKVEIDISAGGAGKGMTDCLAKVADIGMVSRDIYPEEVSRGAWAISVTKDAVVPTINMNNPAINDILVRGVTQEEFQNIFVSGNIKTWGELLRSKVKEPINVYTRSDACGAAETWAKYLGKKQEDLVGIGVYGDPGLTEAVKKDTLGIGYNNINYAYDPKTNRPIDGIRVISIDINVDGRIDEKEDFYSSRDNITAAIGEGRYPSPPARELYFVSYGRPENKVVRQFLSWVLSDGQKFVLETGYVNISKEKLAEGLKQIGDE